MAKIEVGVGRSVSKAACVLATLIILTGIAFPQSKYPKSPGIWLSDEIRYKPSETHVEQLVQSLRRITGLSELHFARDGLLVTGAAPAEAAGSATARRILSCAISSGSAFIIEDHSNSPSVNFGQLNEGLRYEDVVTGTRLLVWRVRLDFNDFRQMQAPREVRDSFDAGFTMLHEILHGLGYKDASNVGELGECEERLNHARAELGLPLRDQYFGDTLRVAERFVSVRLRFRSNASQVLSGPARSRKQYLFFMLPNYHESRTTPVGPAVFDCGRKH